MRAQNRRLQSARVQIAEMQVKPGQAGLGRVAVCRQSQARRPLHRPVREIHRVPTHFAVVQMERGLRNLNIVGQIIGLPVGVVQDHGPAQAVCCRSCRLVPCCFTRGWQQDDGPIVGAGQCAQGAGRRKVADRNTLGRQPRALGAQVYNHRVPSQRIQRGGVRVARHMRQFPCPRKTGLAAHRYPVAGEREPASDRKGVGSAGGNGHAANQRRGRGGRLEPARWLALPGGCDRLQGQFRRLNGCAEPIPAQLKSFDRKAAGQRSWCGRTCLCKGLLVCMGRG